MTIYTQNISKNITNGELSDYIHSCFIPELNIYNQAFLLLDYPLLKTSKVHQNTKFEIPITFFISGEYEGTCFCLLDTYNKDLSIQNQTLLNSLFAESMNILLGKMITKLDNDFNISTLISAPSKREIKINDLENLQHAGSTFSIGYKLMFMNEEFDCRIILNMNSKKTFEV